MENSNIDDVNEEFDIARLRALAELGNEDAQCQLGVCYKFGLGVEEDEVQAATWYGKAAESGNADAQCILGNCYKEGYGVEQDDDMAVYWYAKSAEQDNAEVLRRKSATR